LGDGKEMIIGQIVDGGKLECDLPTLVDTRLLIQANSGGGKSWLLRLIAERANIQTIVLDNEGEFASLREAVDMLLVGVGGELPANPRHAALLARRLVEYKVSAVVDLYELRLVERRQFVKLFLNSLIHLPRELWRPTLVILDEAHIYCPERGSGEAESTEAAITLMSQGRKRGYAGIIATQRLSKLHKDAAAEANNVIIGRTWLDADQARAGDALGLSKADRLKLRDLEQGEFYAFGPAFSRPGIVRFRSDPVRTTHPRPGQRHLLTAPAPSKAIRGVLEKFADLPHEVEVEIRGLDEAHRRIAELERQIRKLKSSEAAPQINWAAIERAVRVAVERERLAWRRKLEQGRAIFRHIAVGVSSAAQSFDKLKVLLVRPANADAFSGRQSRRGKSQSLAAWMAGRRETDDLKPIDKSHRKDDGESPGRSVSERIGGLENFQPRKPNLQVLGEGSMGTADWLARGSIPTG